MEEEKVKIKSLDELFDSEEDFLQSDFSFLVELFTTKWTNISFSNSDELYYFIEGNLDVVDIVDNFFIYKLEKIKLILYDDNDNIFVIFNKRDAETIKTFII